MNVIKKISHGLFKGNPVFITTLGICPSLAVTDSLTKAIGMGIATLFVLIFSNLTLSTFKRIIPENMQSVLVLLVIGTYVSIVDLLLKIYFPLLNEQLGIYIPLIVINSLVLSKAFQYALKNNIGKSLAEGIIMGLGFIFALVILGSIREILGSGSILNYTFLNDQAKTFLFFILPPGAFVVFGFMIAFYKHYIKRNV